LIHGLKFLARKKCAQQPEQDQGEQRKACRLPPWHVGDLTAQKEYDARGNKTEQHNRTSDSLQAPSQIHHAGRAACMVFPLRLCVDLTHEKHSRFFASFGKHSSFPLQMAISG
jgi:hypothetical protein